MSEIVYFSSVSGNTARFVEKLDLPAQRIPLRPRIEPHLQVGEDFVLILPTYGGGTSGAPRRGTVPPQVVKFLNDDVNRNHCRGVIAAGNTNFGESFCLAGDIVSAKLQVPYLYRFELFGTTEDASRVREGLGTFWEQQLLKSA